MPEQNNFFSDYQKLMTTINELFKSKENPFYKSKYVDLPTILEEVKKVCNECNFIFYQYPDWIVDKSPVGNEYKQPVLITTIQHVSGEKINGVIPIVSKDSDDPQKVGAGMTYMRRYSLTCMFGIQEQDDDGNTASSKKTKLSAPDQKEFDKWSKQIVDCTIKEELNLIGKSLADNKSMSKNLKISLRDEYNTKLKELNK